MMREMEVQAEILVRTVSARGPSRKAAPWGRGAAPPSSHRDGLALARLRSGVRQNKRGGIL